MRTNIFNEYNVPDREIADAVDIVARTVLRELIACHPDVNPRILGWMFQDAISLYVSETVILRASEKRRAERESRV